ncbi:hypothetical protein NDK43_06830 [Neobacillus pocheonensis]|uniref:Uncharacterized protein n=1 Tax=Neobacillus pocheonensis TaxID=363869 RepID=A0ABT0W7W2_9BACI|nr:hypothetical protein [Neobacillus pocheonensis]
MDILIKISIAWKERLGQIRKRSSVKAGSRPKGNPAVGNHSYTQVVDMTKISKGIDP